MLRNMLLVSGVIAIMLWANCADAQPEKIAQPKVQPPAVAQGSLMWAGTRLTRVDMDLQQNLGLADHEGLVVAAVDSGSAADKAGLKVNDVPTLVHFDAPPTTKRGRGGLGGIGIFGGKGGLRLWSVNGKGASIVRKQSGDEFSGEYSRGDLKITVAGKLDAETVAIAITQGEQTTKYTSARDVPAEYQRIVHQLMPAGR